MTTSWTTTVWTEDKDFGRKTPLQRIVHAWDNTGQKTACGKPGNGMTPSNKPWAGLVLDRCPGCVKHTA